MTDDGLKRFTSLTALLTGGAAVHTAIETDKHMDTYELCADIAYRAAHGIGPIIPSTQRMVELMAASELHTSHSYSIMTGVLGAVALGAIIARVRSAYDYFHY